MFCNQDKAVVLIQIKNIDKHINIFYLTMSSVVY